MVILFLIKVTTLIQYNTVLALTATIRGSSREKLYQELGLGDPLKFIINKLLII